MHEIDIVAGSMVVMDEDGYVHECHQIDAGLRAAKRQIQRWTSLYTLNVAAAYRMLSEEFAARKMLAPEIQGTER